MPAPITRYRVPGHYFWAGLTALALTGFSFWFALQWPLCWIATGLFLASAAAVLYLASRPAVEIYESHREDRPSRHSLAAYPAAGSQRESSADGAAHAGRQDAHPGGLSRRSEFFERPAAQFAPPCARSFDRWRAVPAVLGRIATVSAVAKKQLAPPRYPLLLPDDEAEVERMFQRLKSVGHLDQKTSSEDK